MVHLQVQNELTGGIQSLSSSAGRRKWSRRAHTVSEVHRFYYWLCFGRENVVALKAPSDSHTVVPLG